MRVYAEAFDAGHAHSFEVWNEAGELVGGGYGIAIGASFTAESQFALESNASRIGMTVLNWHLAHWGFRFNDGKLIGPLWQNMGFREMPRREFLARLAEAVRAAGQERPLAGRGRPRHRVALAAGIVRAAVSARDAVGDRRFPSSGICRDQLADARVALLIRLAASVGAADSGIAAGGTG